MHVPYSKSTRRASRCLELVIATEIWKMLLSALLSISQTVLASSDISAPHSRFLIQGNTESKLAQMRQNDTSAASAWRDRAACCSPYVAAPAAGTHSHLSAWPACKAA